VVKKKGRPKPHSPEPDQGLLFAFENVSVFLKASQVRLEQVKRSLGVPRIDARGPQPDDAAFLLLRDAPRFRNKLLGVAKIIFGIHLSKITLKRRNRHGTYPLIAAPAGLSSAGARAPEFAVSLGGHHNKSGPPL
jgi:hypothetical protein